MLIEVKHTQKTWQFIKLPGFLIIIRISEAVQIKTDYSSRFHHLPGIPFLSENIGSPIVQAWHPEQLIGERINAV